MSMKHVRGSKVETLIKEWDAKIAVLIDQADKINAGQKLLYQEYLQSLQTRRQEVLEVIGELVLPQSGQALFDKDKELSVR